MGEEVAIKKVLVKRVTNCGSCGRWYRITRIYHVHFFGKEKTMRGMVEKDVDEDRMVCPKCYEDMGYIAGKSAINEDVEFITSATSVNPADIDQTLLIPDAPISTNGIISRKGDGLRKGISGP